jgi:hypothetical protein
MLLDASQPEYACKTLIDMINQMGGLDLIVLAMTGFWNADFDTNDWKKSSSVLTVDVLGFYALAKTALDFFESQGVRTRSRIFFYR